MDARNLLREWPTWAKANAKTIFDSPVWRMPVAFNGDEAQLRHAESPVKDGLALDISFDDEAGVLVLGDSSSFPDLHLLWAQRTALPPEVLLALVERECGPVLQMLEDAVRRQVKLHGLHAGAVDAAFRADLSLVADGNRIADLSVGLTPTLTVAFGSLEHLDVTAPEIRNLTREATPEYARVEMSEAEVAALAAGDFVLLADGLASGSWTLGTPDDERVHVCGEATGALTFAQLADDDLPPVPPPESLRLVCRSRLVATGKPARVGLAEAVRIERVEGRP